MSYNVVQLPVKSLSDISKFEEMVKTEMTGGWTPQGGLASFTDGNGTVVLLQALVK